MSVKPTKAMVLAAGFGLRMRPLTEKMPKPLVPVAGQPLLDHVLDKLGDAGVTEAIVNVHYLPDQIINHTASRQHPRVTISDERDQVLGTGGGVVKALPLLGDAPFFHVNSDTLWIDGVRSNLARLAENFDPERMDILLLMAPTATSIGYSGRGDYGMLCPQGITGVGREGDAGSMSTISVGANTRAPRARSLRSVPRDRPRQHPLPLAKAATQVKIGDPATQKIDDGRGPSVAGRSRTGAEQ